MRKALAGMALIILHVFYSPLLHAQNREIFINTDKSSGDDYIEVPDEEAEYPNYTAYIARNIRYPRYAIDSGIQGQVQLRLGISAAGDLEEITVMKGIGGGCSKEAIRVVSGLTKWKPGIVDGKPVDSYKFVTVRFQVDSFYKEMELPMDSFFTINGQAADEDCYPPEFKDGNVEGFITEHLGYPVAAAEYKIRGKVVLRLSINKEGKLEDVEVVKSLPLGCTEEALRVVKMMHNWRPATREGIPVACKILFPITFVL